MFINSIFLPKNLSDQTLPEGVVNTIGNFSHLFSNVFKIVKDGQESLDLIQLLTSTENLDDNIQEELLKVSLLSDNKLAQDNSDISSIVSFFVSQVMPGDNLQKLADSNKIKVSEKTPKYFSMSKSDFLKEIKNLIDSLKNGEVNQLENVEISLITGRVSISINPNVISFTEIESLITEQLQTNDDYKILVQSGSQKLSFEVEPLKAEVNLTISSSLVDSENATNKKIVENSQKASQLQLQSSNQGLTSIETEKVSTIKNDSNQIVSYTDSQAKVTSDQQNPINNEVFVSQNNAVGKNENKTLVSEINNLNRKFEVVNEYDAREILIAKTDAATGKIKGFGTKQPNNTQNKIIVQSNQKISSASMNKYSVQEKTELWNLMEKTNVKEIDVKVQKFEKPNVVNIPKNFSGDNSKPIEIKTDTTITKTSFENKELKNVDPNTRVVKQSIAKNYLEQVIVKQNKTANNTNIEKQLASKPELSTNTVENTKVKNVHDFKPQQELFSENEIVENETKYLAKNESIKTTVTPQNPVDFKSNPHKPINKIELSVKEKIDLQNPKAGEGTKDILPETKKVETTTLKIQVSKNELDNKQKPVEIRSNTKITNTKIETNETQITSTLKDSTNIVVKESIKEAIKEPLAVKTDLNTVSKESEKKDFESNFNSEKTIKNIKEPTLVNKSSKEFVELSNTETKDETVVKNLLETKNVKVDFMQRRVYSQIPKLEVVADKAELKSTNNSTAIDLNVEPKINEKVQTIDEPIKSISISNEAKPKIEKQVWVKVSLEKNENEVVSEVKKSTHQQSKITIDANSDDVKKDFTPHSNSEKESNENPKQKPQTVSIEAVQNTEQKPVVQNQTANQNETSVNVKPEIKTEQNTFKSELHNHETKLASRQVEMVERVKVISSGEMVREVYKVLENGEKQSVVLKLVPKELGAIKIVLDTIDNVLSAKVEVENESVGSVIRNNVDQLKHNLAQSGVHVNSINISYHNSDQKQHGFNNHKRKNPAYIKNGELEEVDETIVTKKMGYNTYEFLA